MPQIYGIEDKDTIQCPYCGNERADLIEHIKDLLYLCMVCSKLFSKK